MPLEGLQETQPLGQLELVESPDSTKLCLLVDGKKLNRE
jgi:hypothetical protein